MERRDLIRRALMISVGGALLVALVASGWSLRDRLWPERASVELDRRIHPGRFEERAPWANEQALTVIETLGPIVADWDTSGTDADRTIHLTLTEDIPLEECNRRVADALAQSGVELLDVVEMPPGDKSQGIEISFGLEGRQTGRMLVLGWLRSTPPPRIALVLDDLGYTSLERSEAFLTMGVPLTTTILPGLENSEAVARRAAALGHQVLLHLPMEPIGYPSADPGEGAILVDMSDDEVRRITTEQLDRIPGAVGLSNHMGSMATQDRTTMEAVFEVVDARGIYFLDSRTSPRSMAGRISRDTGVPCVRNDLFLDHERTAENVSKRLAELADLARKTGSAVGIFHPHTVCLETLPGEIERHRAEGIEFVSVLDLDASRWLGSLPRGHGLTAP